VVNFQPFVVTYVYATFFVSTRASLIAAAAAAAAASEMRLRSHHRVSVTVLGGLIDSRGRTQRQSLRPSASFVALAPSIM